MLSALAAFGSIGVPVFRSENLKKHLLDAVVSELRTNRKVSEEQVASACQHIQQAVAQHNNRLLVAPRPRDFGSGSVRQEGLPGTEVAELLLPIQEAAISEALSPVEVFVTALVPRPGELKSPMRPSYVADLCDNPRQNLCHWRSKECSRLVTDIPSACRWDETVAISVWRQLSLNQAHLMSNSLRPGTKRVSASA